jgi:cbb3-type cytochrome oxidase cytochrome c subunit
MRMSQFSQMFENNLIISQVGNKIETNNKTEIIQDDKMIEHKRERIEGK